MTDLVEIEKEVGPASAPRGATSGRRQTVLSDAYAAHPERFVRKPPTPPALPSAAWINPPKNQPAEKESAVQ